MIEVSKKLQSKVFFPLIFQTSKNIFFFGFEFYIEKEKYIIIL